MEFYTAHFSFLFSRPERNEVKQESTAGDPQPPTAMTHYHAKDHAPCTQEHHTEDHAPHVWEHHAEDRFGQ